MKKDVTDISNMLSTMEENIRFTMDRRSKHYTIIGEIETAMKNISYLKIFMIVLISLMQVVFIARLFKNSKKVGLNPFFDSGL